MKKVLVSIVCLLALSFAIPINAQTRARRSNESYARRYDQQTRTVYDNQVYSNPDSSNYDRYDDRSVWEKSRDKITTAGGAVAGAVIGRLIGGKKGAIIGAVAGGGGAALYTYKIRDKYPRY